MPELPEVETIRRDIARRVLDVPISRVVVFSDRSINLEKDAFSTALEGAKIVDANRKGKYLSLKLSSGMWLAIHLKMSGQIIMTGERVDAHGFTKVSPLSLPNKHTRVQIDFSNGTTLFFNDMRRFGYMHLLSEQQVTDKLTKIGKDVFVDEIDLSFLQNKKTTLKAALLQQHCISGVGNIYADEICFRAGVLPQRMASTLTPKEIEALETWTKQIITTAVKERGTSFGLYVDGQGKQGNYVNFLHVYQRQGLPCLNECGGTIQKTRTAQRGTHFCQNCQK